jgi:uncharacterized protein
MSISLFRPFLFLAFWAFSAPGPAAQQSLDCAGAGTRAETAVCADAGLAALDRELARLYGLALDDPDVDDETRATLQAMQRGRTEWRDACGKSAAGLETCLGAEYALRIHAIREGSARARADDEAGVSVGPTAWACDGLDALLSITFVNTEPALVAIRWRDEALVLPQAVAASGARYASETEPGGKALFWTKGDQALFAAPGGPELACAMVDTD